MAGTGADFGLRPFFYAGHPVWENASHYLIEFWDALSG